MITREQALALAHRWVNGDLPQEGSRPVRCHEFDLGWVLWPEPAPILTDPLTGARRAPEEIGAACAVVDRVSGELVVYPSVPVPVVERLHRDRLGAGSHNPALPPVTGPGTRATLSYRDGSGETRSLTVHSAHGRPHPALLARQQLAAQGVPDADLVALRTDLRLSMLPGSYSEHAVATELPAVRLEFEQPYGPRHDHRAAAVRALVARTGSRYNRMPFPPAVPPAQPEDPAGLGKRLTALFGEDGVRRFEQLAVLAADLPEAAARSLQQTGLPREVPGFFALHLPEADGIAEQAAAPLPDLGDHLAALGRGRRATAAARTALLGQRLLGTDGWALITVDTAQGRIRAVDPDTCEARHLNSDLTAFIRSLALLAEYRPRLLDLPPEQAGPAVAEFQWALAALDRTALRDPENWWAVVVEQLWDGLL
ncbi:SUKH-4 family immunity protein [Streptomyces sp. TLI_171]|uniref:SUKH-4 family immunity protein n=1 Tax=Streptomyces sp. TLI_171 TaxID=1938859 RepID=UPI000C1947E2|nr:SUKH-4 family immunity protein [Streptomyces sp. TLI_171]RKE19736.1 nucleic acid/nucleotide deaminase of polymorphic system toxin [Streptomyces sp. TLI_171]